MGMEWEKGGFLFDRRRADFDGFYYRSRGDCTRPRALLPVIFISVAYFYKKSYYFNAKGKGMGNKARAHST